jgi:hypothetical protein
MRSALKAAIHDRDGLLESVDAASALVAKARDIERGIEKDLASFNRVDDMLADAHAGAIRASHDEIDFTIPVKVASVVSQRASTRDMLAAVRQGTARLLVEEVAVKALAKVAAFSVERCARAIVEAEIAAVAEGVDVLEQRLLEQRTLLHSAERLWLPGLTDQASAVSFSPETLAVFHAPNARERIARWNSPEMHRAKEATVKWSAYFTALTTNSEARFES